MGGGGEIMAGHGWWQQNYGWSWMVVGGGGETMAGRGWSRVAVTKLWLVVGVRGWSHDLVMPRYNKSKEQH